MDVLIHVVNGLLRQAYFVADHWAVFVCALCGGVHIYATPNRRNAWFIGFAVTTSIAAGISGAVDSAALRPLPYILSMLAVIVVIFVALDRHSPESLRYRATGGVAIYAALVLLFAGFDFMLQNHEAAAFAESLGARGDSGAMVRTGRNTLRTVVAWAMWLMGPVGIIVMLLQGAITHRPQDTDPATRLQRIRRPRPRSLHPDAPPPAQLPGGNVAGGPPVAPRPEGAEARFGPATLPNIPGMNPGHAPTSPAGPHPPDPHRS